MDGLFNEQVYKKSFRVSDIFLFWKANKLVIIARFNLI